MDIETLQTLLRGSWCKDTAYGDWNRDVPSMNQCAVTSLIVQDYFGGKILCRKLSNGKNHFLNRLPDGAEIDFTGSQFDKSDIKPIVEQTSSCSRNRLLRHKSVEKRYNLLNKRIDALIIFNTEQELLDPKSI